MKLSDLCTGNVESRNATEQKTCFCSAVKSNLGGCWLREGKSQTIGRWVDFVKRLNSICTFWIFVNDAIAQ